MLNNFLTLWTTLWFCTARKGQNSSPARYLGIPQKPGSIQSVKPVLLASHHLILTHPATEGLRAVTLNNLTAYIFGKLSLNLTKITACSENIYELGRPHVSV